MADGTHTPASPRPTPAERRARGELDGYEQEFFQACRERPDGARMYEHDSERIERMALLIHRAAADLARLYGMLEVARDFTRDDGRTVTLQLTSLELGQRFADAVELGAEAQALLSAHLAALQVRGAPFLADFGCGPGVDPEAAMNLQLGRI